ncbi:MAG: DNA primase, partial [Chloroflexota bacterium]
DFKEALQLLATRAGVELNQFQRETPELKEAADLLRALLEDAVIYYRTQLFQHKAILTYLREKRGLTDSTIETFGLGYAPEGYENLMSHFLMKGCSPGELLEAGLLSEREDGKRFDRFRHRIMIPIRDEQGRMAGFGARIVSPTDVPKFLNSPETPTFSKGRLLYGLDRARKPIRTADQAIIVEGYLDVIALHQAGFENVVSPMGTALTEDQLRLLKKFTRRIVLALDPDAAGQKAVLRGLDAARQAMDREGEFSFDARGLLNHEARLQADLRVASMPDELDPDEIVARDRSEWKRLIEDAKPVVTHVMDTLAKGQNLNDPKVKNQIASQVIPLIEDLPDPLERDTYRQQLARMLRVDEGALIGVQFRGPGMRRARPRPTEKAQPVTSSVVAPTNPTLKIEAYCLAILFRRPELLYRLDRRLQEFGLNPLGPRDFEYTDHQLLFGVIRQAVEQDEKDHYHYLRKHLPEALEGLSKDLLTQTEKLDPLDDRLLEELLARFIDLRRAEAQSNVSELRFLQEEEQQQGGVNLKQYQTQTVQFTRLLQSLDQAKRKLSLKRQF